MSPGYFQGVQAFLSQYYKYFSDSDEQNRKISEIVTTILGIQFSQNEFLVSKGEIRIFGNSVLKNEVFLYKEHILEALHRNGLTDIVDIC